MKVDLRNVEVKELVKELNNRKKTIIPEIVKSLNENIELLKELDVDIIDNGDSDYVLNKFKMNPSGYVEFETEYR